MSSGEGLGDRPQAADTAEETAAMLNGASKQLGADQPSEKELKTSSDEAVGAKEKTTSAEAKKSESVSAGSVPTENVKSTETQVSITAKDAEVSKESDVNTSAEKTGVDENAKSGNEQPPQNEPTSNNQDTASQGGSIQHNAQVEEMEASSSTTEPQKQTTSAEPQEQKTGDEPQKETASDELQKQTISDKPQEQKTSDEPQEQKTSDEPQEQTTSDEPQEETTSDKPEEQTTSDKPQEQTTSDEVQKQTTSEKPQEQPTKMEHQEEAQEEPTVTKTAVVENSSKKTRGRPKAATPKRGRRTPAKVPAADASEKGKAEVEASGDGEGVEPMDTSGTSEAAGTPKLGLVERPVEIMTGKRNRRKVERLSENMTSSPTTPADKKKFSVPEGSGVKLGDCPTIEDAINRTKAEELKGLHKVLYGVPGKSPLEIKRNVRSFCGWEFTEGDAEYKKKVVAVSKENMPVLKFWCSLLKLTVGGTKPALVDKLMTFLMKPAVDGKDPHAKKSEAGKRKRGSAMESKEEVESAEEESNQSEDEEDNEPVSKRKKTNTKKAAGKQAKTPTRSSGRASRGKAKESTAEVEEEEEDDGSPPTDAVIKKQIEKILASSDLEVVTMKTVRQQILDMYADFDLSDKKDFIKSTVKQILGA